MKYIMELVEAAIKRHEDQAVFYKDAGDRAGLGKDRQKLDYKWSEDHKKSGDLLKAEFKILNDIELLTANNQDRKKLIDEILTAIQDGEVITGDRLEDWGQEAYGISHRTGPKG